MTRGMRIALFTVAALCVSYGAYHWYGWEAVPVAITVVGLAAWENLRKRAD